MRNRENYHTSYDEDEYYSNDDTTEYDEQNWDEDEMNKSNDEGLDYNYNKSQRAQYSYRIDRFLTNGIIIVAVLLLAVLLIAFLY